MSDLDLAVEAALRADPKLHALLDGGHIAVCARKATSRRGDEITVYDTSPRLSANPPTPHQAVGWSEIGISDDAQALLEKALQLASTPGLPGSTMTLHVKPQESATLRAAQRAAIDEIAQKLLAVGRPHAAPSLQEALEAALSLCDFDPFGPDRLKVAVRTEGGPGSDRTSVVVEHAGRPYGIQASVPLGPIVRNVVAALMTEAPASEQAQRWLVAPPADEPSATLRAARAARAREIQEGHFPALLERNGMTEAAALLEERLARR